MKSARGNAAQRRPNLSHRRPSGEIPASAVYGFPMLENQFNVLQSIEPGVSTSQVQGEERLIDPRSTRLSRQQAYQDSKLQSELMTRELCQMEELSTLCGKSSSVPWGSHGR